MKGGNRMKDQQITAMLYARSELELEQLKKKYGPLFARIARDFLGCQADVEEIMNDLYFALWNRIPPDRPENLSGYALRILRNLCIKRFHSNNAQKRGSQYQVALEEIAPYLPGGQTPEEVLSAKELTRVLNAFLREQGEEDRSIFIRRYYLAETPAQIGRAMGRSGHFVSVRLHRMREKLRESLVREGIFL